MTIAMATSPQFNRPMITPAWWIACMWMTLRLCWKKRAFTSDHQGNDLFVRLRETHLTTDRTDEHGFLKSRRAGREKKEIQMFNFKNWAQPVKHRGWAMMAILLHAVSRISGYRICNHVSHRAWERAVL
jgi:hypothetical protein